MPVANPKPRLGSRGQPGQTRAAILRAALQEFAQEGMAGARTDAIARAACVNKALLYYYFKDKQTLYGAALDEAFQELSHRLKEVLGRDLPPGKKVLAYAGAHFDFVASHPLYPRLVQNEMMRAGRGVSPQMRHIVERYWRPLAGRLRDVLQQGISSGEFRPVDPAQFVFSMVAVIVFYFCNAPAMEMMTRSNPLSPQRIRERRAAVLDFISAALFRQRAGAQGEAQ